MNTLTTIRLNIFKLFILIIAMMICGCTHSRMVSRIDLAKELERTNNPNTGEITKLNSNKFRAKHIFVVRDSVFWLNPGMEVLGSRHISGHISNIREISLISYGKGVAEGFVTGAAIGFAGGFFIGYADGDDPPSNEPFGDFLRFSAGEKGLILGVALGGLGAIVGIVTGAISGSREKMIIKYNQPVNAANLLPKHNGR